MSSRTRPGRALVRIALLGGGVLALAAVSALGQDDAASPAAASAGQAAGAALDDSLGIWSLFRQSFDLFTVVLIAGSIAAMASIIRNIFEVRASVIMPPKRTRRLVELVEHGRYEDAWQLVRRDESFVGSVVRAAMRESGRGRGAMREAAELAASDQSAKWFRKIELLNVIGNLGPLVGLAGTVWGMIIAFTSLGAAGGQAGPTDLSLGISKALFHTLLGLCLAIPCLLVFGLYRGVVDRICTRAMVESARLVELLPSGAGSTERNGADENGAGKAA
ncbi:MAG: MotA/TolQ/ExbB proton channel family protein [Phycisphaerales bacterium]